MGFPERGGAFAHYRLVRASLVLAKDLLGLLDLAAEQAAVLQNAEDLSVVHLEKHTSDLSGLLLINIDDLGVEALAKGILALLGGHVGKGRSGNAVVVGALHGLLIEVLLALALAVVGAHRGVGAVGAAHGAHVHHVHGIVVGPAGLHHGPRHHHSGDAGVVGEGTLLLLHELVAGIAALRKADVKVALVEHHLSIKLTEGGIGRLLRLVANKSNTAEDTLGGHLERERLNLAKGSKRGAEALIVEVIGEVLDVEVAALILVHIIVGRLAIGLLAAAANEEGVIITGDLLLLTVELLNDGDSLLVGRHINNGVLGGELGMAIDESSGGSAVRGEELLERLLGDIGLKVLEENLLEGLLLLLLSLNLADEDAGGKHEAVDLLVVEALNSGGGGFLSLEVDVTIAKTDIVGVSALGGRDNRSVLAAQLVELLVGHLTVQILEENVTSTALAESGVARGPEDAKLATGLSGNLTVVELLLSALGVGRILEVNIGVPKRVVSVDVTAKLDGKDHTNLAEDGHEGGLRILKILGEITHVKGARGGGIIHSFYYPELVSANWICREEGSGHAANCKPAGRNNIN